MTFEGCLASVPLIVFRAFVGHAPAGMQVGHIDQDPLNCELTNLYMFRTSSGRRMLEELSKRAFVLNRQAHLYDLGVPQETLDYIAESIQ